MYSPGMDTLAVLSCRISHRRTFGLTPATITITNRRKRSATLIAIRAA